MRECTVDENVVLASMLQLGMEDVLLAQKAWVDRLAIEAEREACAALAERCVGALHTSGGCCGARIAALIRARGAR